jgi:hypothetical protein
MASSQADGLVERPLGEVIAIVLAKGRAVAVMRHALAFPAHGGGEVEFAEVGELQLAKTLALGDGVR